MDTQTLVNEDLLDQIHILEAQPVEPTDAEVLAQVMRERFPGTDGSPWQVGRFLGRAAGFELANAGAGCVRDGFATGVDQGFEDLDLFTFTMGFRTGCWDSEGERAAAWAAQMLWGEAMDNLDGPRKLLIQHHVEDLVGFLGSTPYWVKYMVEAY